MLEDKTRDELILELKELREQVSKSAKIENERKRAEEALRINEKFLNNIFDGIQDGISILDRDMNIIRVNKTMERWHPDKLPLVGKKCFNAYHCRSEPCEYCPNIKAMKEKTACVNTVPREVAGRIVGWEEVYSFPLQDDDGNIIGMINYVRDITERKRAEEALSDSQQKLQLVMDSIPQAIFWKDTNSVYLGCNKVLARDVGLKDPGDIIGKTDYDLPTTKEQSDSYREFDRRVMSADTPIYHIIEEQRRSDGTIAWLDTNKIPLHDFKGNVIGVLCTYEDITERKRAEEKVRLAYAYNRSLIEASLDPLVTIAPDGKITDVNLATENVTGYPREKLIGTYFSSYFTDPEKAKKGYRNVFKHGSVTDYPLEIRHRNGQATPVIYNASVYRNASGSVIGVFAAARDITELRRAEVALKESEEKYRQIVETTNQGICTLDAAMVITFVNKIMADMMGYLPEEIIGRSVWDFMDEAGIAIAVEKMEEQRRGISDSFEIKAIRKNGTPIWVIISAVPNYDKDGRFSGSFAMLTDITERKRAEEALTSSQQMLQLIMDNIPQAVFWKDRNSVYIGCNKVFAAATGLGAPENIRGKTDYDMPWSREQSDFFREYDQRIMENDRPEYHIIEQQRESGGRTAWLETNKVPLHDAKGKVTGILGTYEDITERKRADEALRRNEQMLKQSQEIAHLGSWELNLITNTLSWSEEVYRIFGLRPQEFGATYEAFLEAVHPDDRAAVDAAYWGSIREGSNTYEIEHRVIKRSNGEIRIVQEKCEHIRDASGRIIRSAGMIHDITERKRVEEALEEAKNQAEIYLDLMGHDINNLNQVGIGYLELALDTLDLDQKGTELIAKPLEALENSSKLIDKVRKIQQIKSGERKLYEIDVARLLRELIPKFTKINGREVTINYVSGCHCHVMANDLLADVFSNILGNAIKHSSGPLAINVRVSKIEAADKAYCKVTIEDNGPGIPDSVKKKLFSRFQRGHTKASGKGLGLYLVRSLVQYYHGNVWIEDSVPGDYTKGSRFVVMLPEIEESVLQDKFYKNKS